MVHVENRWIRQNDPLQERVKTTTNLLDELTLLFFRLLCRLRQRDNGSSFYGGKQSDLLRSFGQGMAEAHWIEAS